MARAIGQVDPRKTEAIVEAAADLFSERGAAASMGEIARRAGVSKQTLYNRYPSKAELARALALRRSEATTAPLRESGDPETVLIALGRSLIDTVTGPVGCKSLRGVVLLTPTAPDIALAAPSRRSSLATGFQMKLSDIEVRDDQRRRAMLGGDVGALEDLLTDDFTWVHSSAKTDDKPAFLKGFRSGRLQCFKLDPSEVSIAVHGDAAVVTGTLDMDVALAGLRKAQRILFTAVWIDAEPGPILLRWHGTRLPDAA